MRCEVWDVTFGCMYRSSEPITSTIAFPLQTWRCYAGKPTCNICNVAVSSQPSTAKAEESSMKKRFTFKSKQRSIEKHLKAQEKHLKSQRKHLKSHRKQRAEANISLTGFDVDDARELQQLLLLQPRCRPTGISLPRERVRLVGVHL